MFGENHDDNDRVDHFLSEVLFLQSQFEAGGGAGLLEWIVWSKSFCRHFLYFYRLKTLARMVLGRKKTKKSICNYTQCCFTIVHKNLFGIMHNAGPCSPCSWQVPQPSFNEKSQSGKSSASHCQCRHTHSVSSRRASLFHHLCCHS